MEHPGLVQIGTVHLPKRTRCAICGKAYPEMALTEDGLISAYHWRCIDRHRARAAILRQPITGEQLSLM